MTTFPHTVTIPLSLQTIPPIMRRRAHTLILLVDETNHFVLGKKDLYPEGIDRMVGGGTDGEEPTTAALRELREEVGLQLTPTDLTPLAQVIAQVTNPDQVEPLTFITYLFAAHVERQALKPDSDLDGLAFLSETDLESLIGRYQKLPPTIDNELGFAWADYGKLYGQIHQLALDHYRQVQSAL